MKRFILTVIVLFIIYSISINVIENQRYQKKQNNVEIDVNDFLSFDSLMNFSLISDNYEFHRLGHLIEGEVYIVIYSPEACNMCVFDLLNKLKFTIIDQQILIIAAETDIRGLKFLCDNYKISAPFYTNKECMPEFLTLKQNPVVIYINKNRKIIDSLLYDNNIDELLSFVNRHN